MSEDGLTARVVARIRRDFRSKDVDHVCDRLRSLELPLLGGNSRERVVAAVVMLASGDVRGFDHAAAVAESDWRDVLVFAGLEHEDWPAQLDAAFPLRNG